MEMEETRSNHKTNVAQMNAPAYNISQQVALDERHLRDARCMGYFPQSEAANAYKVLRTQLLQRMQSQGWNTLMITSPRTGEGKTLTALNLAFVCALEFAQTVLLVDCDLQSQNVHKILGVQSEKGLSDYLLHATPLQELILWPGVEKMTFISGGETVRESAELLNSPRMKELVPEMKARYAERIIIFDTPGLLDGPDSLSFLPMVEGVLLVVENGRSSKDDVKKALSLIPAEKQLGAVLNRHTASQVKNA